MPYFINCDSVASVSLDGYLIVKKINHVFALIFFAELNDPNHIRNVSPSFHLIVQQYK